MTELKPCPFCGGEASIKSVLQDGFYTVTCGACAASSGITGDSRQQAIDAWNKRARPEVVWPEPTEIQCRTKPEWDKNFPWSDWEKCSPEHAADYERVPVLHKWVYEVRKLYTRAQVEELLAQQHDQACQNNT